MLEGKETPVGLVFEPDMDRWIRRFQPKGRSKVASKKVRNKRLNELFRNGITLSISTISRNNPVSADDRPLVIYKGVGDTTVEQALDDELIDAIKEYPKFRPSLWDDASQRLRAVYYQRAIDSLGGGYALTLNIAPHLMRKTFDKGGLDYLYRALRRHLQNHLGRPVDFYIALESSCPKTQHFSVARPHLHGAIICRANEIRRAHKAFRAFNRGAKPEFFKARPAVMKRLTDGHNWSQYCLKSLAFRSFALADLPGPDMCCPQSLRREAKRLYEIDRQTILERIDLIKRRIASRSA
jgi:hypothetical protein